MGNLATALRELVGLVEVTPRGHIGYPPGQLAPKAAQFFAAHGETLALAVADSARIEWLCGGEDRTCYQSIGGEWVAQDGPYIFGGATLRAAIDAATTEQDHD